VIPGTQEHVLRFRWDEPWDHDDNFYSIRMIVAYMKRHGAEFMPSAASALAAIGEEDFQQRVVDKFLGIQKNLRQAKLLDSDNKQIIHATTEAEAEAEGDDGDPQALEEKKVNSAAVLMSRAKGVRTKFHTS
jgi:hypothetical protein